MKITKSQLKEMIREAVLKEQNQRAPFLNSVEIYLPTAGFTRWTQMEHSTPTVTARFSLIPNAVEIDCYVRLEDGDYTVVTYPQITGSKEGLHQRSEEGVSKQQIGTVLMNQIQKVADLIISRMQDRIANA